MSQSDPFSLGCPCGGTSKDENRGRPTVEPGNFTGAVSPSFSLAPGPLGTNNCRREHECQSLQYAEAPRAATLVKSQGGPRDGRAGGSVGGAGRAQGHRSPSMNRIVRLFRAAHGPSGTWPATASSTSLGRRSGVGVDPGAADDADAGPGRE